MTETTESKFDWRNAVGLVGLALAVVGMWELSIEVRLLFLLASAICMSISFCLQSSWPRWVRLALSISAVAVLAFIGWSA